MVQVDTWRRWDDDSRDDARRGNCTVDTFQQIDYITGASEAWRLQALGMILVALGIVSHVVDPSTAASAG